MQPSQLTSQSAGGPDRIIVVQPQTLLREAVARTLDGIEGLEVVCHVGTLEEGVLRTRELRPDVVIVDAGLGDAKPAEVVSALKQVLPEGRVLVVADRADQVQVERALGAGADGYTLKEVTCEEFAGTIRRVAKGEIVLHPDAASVLVRSFSALANGARQQNSTLTPRQREIVRLLALGLQNKQIARRLCIGVDTVKTHVSKIMEKLGAGSRTEVVAVAMREGLVA